MRSLWAAFKQRPAKVMSLMTGLVVVASVLVMLCPPAVAEAQARSEGMPTAAGLISIDPEALPEWASKSGAELVATGLAMAGMNGSDPLTRGSFMSLAVAAAGRSVEDWPNQLRRESIVIGRPDGTLALTDPISRAEAVAFLIKLLGAEPEGCDLLTEASAAGQSTPVEGSTEGVLRAPDLAGHWSEGFFIMGRPLGLIRGFPDGSARPDQPLTAAEAVVLIDRFLRAGEGRLALDAGMPAASAIISCAQGHILAFVESFASEPYDFEPLLATCVGQAQRNISQNQRFYLDRYARGSRLKFEIVSLNVDVTQRSVFLATVRTEEKMREYVDGKVTESEYSDSIDLRRVGQTWLVFR